MTVEEHARRLAVAAARGQAIAALTESEPRLSLDDAYAVQRLLVAGWVADGRSIVGRKVGLTSKAMQDMLGVDEPDFGVLLDDMVLASPARIDAATLIAPRVEPEIAFILRDALRGAEVSADHVLAATRAVAPAIEVIDSRIADWRIRLADTVADNASSALAIIGEWVPLGDVDLAAAFVDLQVGDDVVRGESSAVMGHPAEAVAWLVRTLARFGEGLEAGDLVIPGSMTRALPVASGSLVQAQFSFGAPITIEFA
jgi:2-keto-4-pentenoate hydratase